MSLPGGHADSRAGRLLSRLLVVLVLVVVGCGQSSSPAKPQQQTPQQQRPRAELGTGSFGTAGLLSPPGARSGLTWNSGIFPVDRVGSAASYASALSQAERGRGRLSDVEQAGQWNDNWPALTSMEVLAFMDPNIVASVDLPPFPASGSWKDAAAGAYDLYYRRMGQRISQLRTKAPTILRLAWEFNISGPPYGATASFTAGWRRAVTQIRVGAGDAGSSIYFSWCLAGRLPTDSSGPLTAFWPGDQYVNFVGIDEYDTPATTANSFPFGETLDAVAAFAAKHNKKMAIEEWGLHHTNSGDGGGDNPLFIRAMFQWIKSHTSILLYEQYFQDDAADNVNSSLFSPDKDANPRSRAAYLAEINGR